MQLALAHPGLHSSGVILFLFYFIFCRFVLLICLLCRSCASPSTLPTLMNIHRSTPITIARYGRSRNKTQDFEELSSLRSSSEPSPSFSPNLGSPSPPETPNLSHCVSCIGKYLLLEPLEGDHVFRAVHLHSGEELVCKVKTKKNLKNFPDSVFRGSVEVTPSFGGSLGSGRNSPGIMICGLLKRVYF